MGCAVDVSAGLSSCVAEAVGVNAVGVWLGVGVSLGIGVWVGCTVFVFVKLGTLVGVAGTLVRVGLIVGVQVGGGLYFKSGLAARIITSKSRAL